MSFLDDVGDAISSAASAVADVATSVADRVEKAAILLGIPEAHFFEFCKALVGKASVADVVNGLKTDFETLKRDKGAAEAYSDGDYRKAWNIATDNGKSLDAAQELARPSYQAPNYNPDQRMNMALNGSLDLRATTQELYDAGYDEQAKKVEAKADEELRTSPLGAFLLMAKYKNEVRPLPLLRLAREFEKAAGIHALGFSSSHRQELLGFAKELRARAAQAPPVSFFASADAIRGLRGKSGVQDFEAGSGVVTDTIGDSSFEIIMLVAAVAGIWTFLQMRKGR